uniref:Uncharacterized protein n=1 Tax=viral metagenome TaxID=1070528 RepID=A0A6M3M9W7_9ZZZZ
MSSSKQPSFIGINEKEGIFTIAFLTHWYNENRCDTCPRFHMASQGTRGVVAFCELIEAEKPCEITVEGEN